MYSNDLLESANPVTYPDWDDVMLNSSGYSIFHSSAWCKVISESYGYEPLYFISRKGELFETVIPFMEVASPLTGKRGISLPFTDYGPMIIENPSENENYFNFITDLGKKQGWKYLEFRDDKIIPPNSPVEIEFYQHTLNLSQDGKEVFGNFRDSTKRNIKKAKKKGITTSISQSQETMNEFYRLNTKTRKKHGLPPQPVKFFKKMFENIIDPGQGFVVEAKFENRVIAVALYLTFGNKIIYKYGASDAQFLNLRANNLVMWQAIEWACKNSFKTFDFGRTEVYNQGLIQFKNGWGCEPQLIKYYKYLLSAESFVLGNGKQSHFYEKVFRNTPEPVLKLFGNLIYKHMG